MIGACCRFVAKHLELRTVDLRRSTVDRDFTCFNSMAGRNSPPTCVKFQKSDQPFHLLEAFSSDDQSPFVCCLSDYSFAFAAGRRRTAV